MARFFTGSHVLLGAGIGLWLAAAAFGTKQLNHYAFTPGATSHPNEQWPADTQVARGTRGPIVVLALHPECPCSRATLEEMKAVLKSSGRNAQMVLLFLDDDADRPASQSALYASAGDIPGCTRILDTTGAEFRRFGFRTSGETHIYREDGMLLFSGGVTGSRGHVGDNPGRRGAIASLNSSLLEAKPAVVRVPTFGCSIFGDPES